MQKKFKARPECSSPTDCIWYDDFMQCMSIEAIEVTKDLVFQIYKEFLQEEDIKSVRDICGQEYPLNFAILKAEAINAIFEIAIDQPAMSQSILALYELALKHDSIDFLKYISADWDNAITEMHEVFPMGISGFAGKKCLIEFYNKYKIDKSNQFNKIKISRKKG